MTTQQQHMTIEEVYERLQEHGYQVTFELPDYQKLFEQARLGPLDTPIPEPRMLVYKPERTVIITLMRSYVTQGEYVQLVQQLQDESYIQ